jgi:hypothetical protein
VLSRQSKKIATPTARIAQLKQQSVQHHSNATAQAKKLAMPAARNSQETPLVKQ